jgi:ribonucleotide monophosphatase NagD (HAD superfamily)|tara:strand:+ start:760 stop:1197 length:438 start_codon:yes stop_codon:yes gene_type:complete
MLEKKIVICDIDGTIANNDHRQHLLKEFKDWDIFFAQLHLDEPILDVIEKIKDLKREGKEIVFLTGRPERYRSSTKEWLSKYFNFKFQLEMRKDKDLRNKLDSKKDSLLVIGKENIFKIFENDYQLIQLWNSMGLDVEDVNYLID